MTKSRLRNKFLKNMTKKNKVAYNKQRNYCVSLVRTQKRMFLRTLTLVRSQIRKRSGKL